MATVDWKEVETWIKRWNEYESIFNLVNGVHDAGAEALIRRVERLTAALDGTARKLDMGAEIIRYRHPDSQNWADNLAAIAKDIREALKEEPDSVGPALICVDSSCPCDGGDCGCFSSRGDKIRVVKI